MAWLQEYPSGIYHLNFRFGGQKFKRSLKTKNQAEANGRLQRLEENIKLLASGRLEIPAKADVATFLLSDGRLDQKPRVNLALTLGDPFSTYLSAIPEGSIEGTTLSGLEIHRRHLERKLGRRFPIASLKRENLQKYVSRRAKDPGIRGRVLSPTTIRKEVSTLRAVWNWARDEELVTTQFPNKGLKYPKLEEKPRFQTWDEITTHCSQSKHSDAELADLWDCLFLQYHEICELLDYVRRHAAQSWIYPMVFTAAHTGARRSELLRSELSDNDATHITIRETKRVKGRRSTRRTPISSELRAVLDEWRANHPGGRFTFCMTCIPRSNAGRKGVERICPDEKPPFQTWEEIERQIALDDLTTSEADVLWDCLYLPATKFRISSARR